MANISNKTRHKIITGTDSKDTIKNFGLFVTINAGAGNDFIFADDVEDDEEENQATDKVPTA